MKINFDAFIFASDSASFDFIEHDASCEVRAATASSSLAILSPVLAEAMCF